MRGAVVRCQSCQSGGTIPVRMDLVEVVPDVARRHPWQEARFRFFVRLLDEGVGVPGLSWWALCRA